MSAPECPGPAVQRYDACLGRAKHGRLQAGQAVPQPSVTWPAENRDLLERYRDWLLGGGLSAGATRTLYIPMAGHMLGLTRQPFQTFDLEAACAAALAYVEAKHASAEWLSMCRNALEKFRRFVRQTRGEPEGLREPVDLRRYQTGLPTWLVAQLERYQRLKQRGWRPARLEDQTRRFWGGHTRFWRWLLDERGVTDLADLRRQHLFDYIDASLAQHHAVSYINNDLRQLHGFLDYLQSQGLTIPHGVLRVPCLKQPDVLPKFLTDEQVRALCQDIDSRLAQAHTARERRDALLDRAVFYLLWHGGLRRGEVEDLLLDDLDVDGRRLTVRQGKFRQDRTVYLTTTAVKAVQDYLPQRGPGLTRHVFLYRNRPLGKDLIHGRLKVAGERLGFKVHAHRLRHTMATQLLNAGCRVTSIQKLLGHQRLNSTMRYARVHDQTVAADYYTAMEQVEQRLQSLSVVEHEYEPLRGDERAELLGLARQLAEPELTTALRLVLTERLQRALRGHEPNQAVEGLRVQQLHGDAPPDLAPISTAFDRRLPTSEMACGSCRASQSECTGLGSLVAIQLEVQMKSI